MRILAHLFKQPPVYNAGGQLMAHCILRDMVRRGHETRVINQVPRGGPKRLQPYDYQGVAMYDSPAAIEVARLYAWCDVVLTHLDTTRQAMEFARRAGKPLVHIVHNEMSLRAYGVQPSETPLVVFNSEWVREAVAWQGPWIVVHPPVFAEDYRTIPGDAITLVNLTAAKGADLFYELARRMPEREFLGVRGAYGIQIVPARLPGNVRIVGNTPDIRSVYGQTRIVLMPSEYESWGRVAVEAAASGIPTIAHPTPGLREALGDAGIFVDRKDVAGWVVAIRGLDDPATYREWSEKALRRSRELDPRPELERLERELSGLVSKSTNELVRKAPARARDLPASVTPVRVDFVASLRHYVDHLAPMWHALPAGVRGSFYVSAAAVDHAKHRGLKPVPYYSPGELVRMLSRDDGPVVTAGFGNLKVTSKSGRPQIFCEHGAGQSYVPHTDPAYSGAMACRENVVLFLCPNDYSAALNRRSFPDRTVVVVGCPKMDAWHVRPPKPKNAPPVVAVSFHWDGLAFPETRTSWPHFREALPNLAARFKVLGHGHPRIIDRIALEYRKLGIEVVREFEEVLERADVFVVDNSSTLFEFASTGRPVVVLNAPWYRRNVHHGLRFWDCADVGIQCDRPEDLVSAVERALEDPPEQKAARERAIAKVYAIRDGTASKRAAEAIVEVLRSRWPGAGTDATVEDSARIVTMRASRSFAQGGETLSRGMVFETDLVTGRVLKERGFAVFTGLPARVAPEASAAGGTIGAESVSCFEPPGGPGGMKGGEQAVIVQMQARRSFIGAQGEMIRKNIVFDVEKGLGEQYRRRGLAVFLTSDGSHVARATHATTAVKPDESKPIGPSETQSAGPAESKPVQPSESKPASPVGDDGTGLDAAPAKASQDETRDETPEMVVPREREAGIEVAGEEAPGDGIPAEEQGSLAKPKSTETLKHLGGGWYELPDGRRVHGRKKAEALLEEAAQGASI